MRIVVCIKHAPEPDSAGYDHGMVIRDAGSGLSELDTYALEAGVALAQELRLAGEAAETVAVTMGPAGAEATLRRAFAVGADEGVHVLDDALASSDAHATARVLADVVRHLDDEFGVGLVLCGMAAVDGLAALVPTLVGAELGWPVLARGDRFEVDLPSPLAIEGASATISRTFGTVRETLVADLPAVVTVTDQANVPRLPRGDAIVAARTKEYATLTLADLGVDPATVGAAGARTLVESAEPVPPRPPGVQLADAAELADFLAERGLLR